MNRTLSGSMFDFAKKKLKIKTTPETVRARIFHGHNQTKRQRVTRTHKETRSMEPTASGPGEFREKGNHFFNNSMQSIFFEGFVKHNLPVVNCRRQCNTLSFEILKVRHLTHKIAETSP